MWPDWSWPGRWTTSEKQSSAGCSGKTLGKKIAFYRPQPIQLIGSTFGELDGNNVIVNLSNDGLIIINNFCSMIFVAILETVVP